MGSGPVGTAALLHDWRSLLLGDMASPVDLVWAVRRDWPDGTHELISPRRSRPRAQRALANDAAYWRRGPVRPRLSLGELTLAECRAHLRGSGFCRSVACPMGVPASAPVVQR